MKEGSSRTVGVLIVNWNSGPLLIRCLDALAGQTLPADRVLVVDNASGDGSEQAAIRPGVELLKMTGNLGFAEANNIGVDHLANCEWIALLNPDAFPEPRWLQALMDQAGKDPAVVSFASRQLLADHPDILDGAGDVYSVAGLAWRRHHGGPADRLGLNTGEIFGPCAAAGLYRRAAFLEAGGFDRTFFCYFEDVDLAFRLRLLGYRSVYVAEAVVHHVGSALSGYRSDFAAFHGHRNMVWTFVKNMPPGLFLRYLPGHVLMNLMGIAALAARGQFGTVLRAKWAAVREIPRVLRERARVQSLRRAPAVEIRAAMVKGIRALGVGRRD